MDELENQNIPKVLNIWQRINLVMGEVAYVRKQQSTAGLPYKTVSHDSVIGALHESLTCHGVGFYHTVEEFKHDGNRVTCKFNLRLVNCDDPSDFTESTVYSEGIDSQDKGYGKALSYACKAYLLKTFCIETGDAADRVDTSDSGDETNEEFKPEKITAVQYRTICDMVGDNKSLHASIVEHLPGKKLENMTSDYYDRVIAYISKTLNGQK